MAPNKSLQSTPFAARLSLSVDFLLLAQAQQRAKPQFHRFPLGLQTGRSERVFHEFIVDHNVGSHDVYHQFFHTHFNAWQPASQLTEAKAKGQVLFFYCPVSMAATS